LALSAHITTHMYTATCNRTLCN